MHIPIYIISTVKEANSFKMPSEDEIYEQLSDTVDYVDSDNKWMMENESLPPYFSIVNKIDDYSARIRVKVSTVKMDINQESVYFWVEGRIMKPDEFLFLILHGSLHNEFVLHAIYDAHI